MPKEIRDSQDYVVATIARNRTSCGLDYVAIKNHENLICVSIEDVPAFMRAVMDAANRAGDAA